MKRDLSNDMSPIVRIFDFYQMVKQRRRGRDFLKQLHWSVLTSEDLFRKANQCWHLNSVSIVLTTLFQCWKKGPRFYVFTTVDYVYVLYFPLENSSGNLFHTDVLLLGDPIFAAK